jgi:hypothetical protein
MDTNHKESQAGAVRTEEYRFLRQELEANKAYVFERPLLIVGATLAGVAGLSGGQPMEALPIVFLAVLLFNLWFTANRMVSSGRIIGYIQLVHEGRPKVEWIGWENALRRYREWQYAKKQMRGTEPPPSKTIPAQQHGIAYYPAIFYFHVLLGTLITLIIMNQIAGANPKQHDIGTADVIWLGTDILALILFCGGAFRLRPDVLRHDIEEKRQLWLRVFGVSHEMTPVP